MDPNRFKEAFARLESLDDRLSHRIRSRSLRNRSSPTVESLDERVRDVAECLLDLKDIVRELMVAIASKPAGKPGE